MALFHDLLKLTIKDLLSITEQEFASKVKNSRSPTDDHMSRSAINHYTTGKRDPDDSNRTNLINAIQDEIELRIKKDSNFTESRTVKKYLQKVKTALESYGAYDAVKYINQSNLIDVIEFLLNYSFEQPNRILPTLHFERKLLNQAPSFLGREDEVNEVFENITKNHRSTYLQGIGGIGKSEIVKAVINKIASLPVKETGISDIVFINYDNQGDDSIKSAIILNTLKKLSHSSLEADYAKALNYLANIGNKLLFVVDNIESITDEFETIISSYLPNAIFIFSGRIYSEVFYRPNFSPCKILPLSQDNSISLFCKHFYDPSLFHISETNYEEDKADILKIVELVDRHTVTIELLAKLARKQNRGLYVFLDTLNKCGFRFQFTDDNGNPLQEEKVGTRTYSLLNEEALIIEQLQKLFRVFKLEENEVNTLIQISVIPNLNFTTAKAKKWFGLSSNSVLLSLSDKGWLIKGLSGQEFIFSIHSIISAAVRAQFLDVLHSKCQPFIVELTEEMINSISKSDRTKKNLIQFSWAINDIFTNMFSSIADCRFLYTLSRIYDEISYYNRAATLCEKALQICSDDRLKLDVLNLYATIVKNIGLSDKSVSIYRKLLKIVSNDLRRTDTTIDLSVYGALVCNLAHSLRLTAIHEQNSKKRESIYVEIFQLLDEGINILSNYPNSYNYAQALHIKGQCILQHTFDFQQAEKLFQKAYSIALKLDKNKINDCLKADLLRELGSLYGQAVDNGTADLLITKYNTANDYLQKALEIYKHYYSEHHLRTLDTRNTQLVLEFQNLSENRYVTDLNEYYAYAPKQFHHLITEFKKLLCHYNRVRQADNTFYDNSILDIYNAYSNLASCYHTYADLLAEYCPSKNTKIISLLENALENYLNALDEEIKQNKETSHGIATDYSNLGNVYFSLFQYTSNNSHIEEAFAYQEKAIGIYKQFHDLRSVIYALFRLSQYHYYLEDYSNVISILDELQHLSNTVPNGLTTVDLADIATLYANCYNELGDTSRAVEYFESARDLYIKAGYSEQDRAIKEIDRFIRNANS